MIAKKIKIDGLKSELQKLKHGKIEHNIVGITSNAVDCIYFTCENEQFNIEFEAMKDEQMPFLAKFKNYADAKNIETQIISYNNKSQDKSGKLPPVLRILTKANIDEIVEIARDMQRDVFGNNAETLYEIVS